MMPYKRDYVTLNKAVINYLPRCTYHLLYCFKLVLFFVKAWQGGDAFLRFAPRATGYNQRRSKKGRTLQRERERDNA